jgi:hypothetical protein
MKQTETEQNEDGDEVNVIIDIRKNLRKNASDGFVIGTHLHRQEPTYDNGHNGDA